jgi:GT2 family glycosyltransferase/glycosyltransferase involved in cell wall biosynthesis
MGAKANGSTVQLDERLSRLRFSPINASFRLYGYFDGVHGRSADGWIFDAASPSSTLTVEIYDGTRRLGTAPAGLFRSDLDAVGISGGDHAFRFELPAEIFDGGEHDIWVRVANSGLAIPGSPRRLATRKLNGAEPARVPVPVAPIIALTPVVPVTPIIAVTPVVSVMPATPAVSVTPVGPSDRDDAILHSLHAITEALIAQTRALHALMGQAVAQQSAQQIDAEPLPPQVAMSPSQVDTPALEVARPPLHPLVAEILARPAGSHDYIVFAIIDWGFRVQRPQHLATRLAGLGNRVFYVSITFNELTAGGPRFAVTGRPADGVFEITLSCRAPAPIVYSGFDDPDQLAELAEATRGVVGALKLQSPVCILQLPSWYPVAAGIPGATLIFDCLDHLAGFSGVAPRVVELEQVLIEAADSVVVTSDFLAETVGRQRPVDAIRNAADVRYFSQRPAAVYQPAGRPVIGYYGAIAEWFDIDLIEQCARRHPQWHFVLIGAIECCDISAVADLSNVVFLGEKPYAELTHYLYAFDVCIIPFKLVDLTRATNPVKVYEYLCAGKPVVATDLPELRRLPPKLVEVTRTASEFDRAIAACLRQKDAAAIRRRQLWSGRHTWEARARKLACVVERHYPPLSVVVVCFNNLPFTTACLESLLTFSDYPDLEIICVDNGSTDGTADHLRDLARCHGAIRPLRNATNLGFAGGNNVGIRAARGEFVVLLNNDTYVTQGWVRDLIRPMQRQADIGMTGPLTNMAGNEQKIAIAYSNMEEMAQASAAFTVPRSRGIFPTRNLAFFCVAIRRAVIEQVGELDEGYGSGYFEDDDYCMRVRKAGHQLAVCDDVFVHHHHSASFDLIGEPAKTALMKRNRRIFEKRWGRWKPHTYREAPGFGEG